jgi:hypothetical protein
MFNELPSRRITERRQALGIAVYSAIVIALTIVTIVRHQGFSWSDLGICIFLLCIGVIVYRRLRHVDPWDPPEYKPNDPVIELKIAQDNENNG